MIKQNKLKLIITSIIILLPVVAGLLLWDRLPDSIATHWGADGIANGWSSKPFAVFGLPLFIFAMHWICVLISSVDPKKQNITSKPFSLVIHYCNYFLKTAINTLLDINAYGYYPSNILIYLL